MTREIEPRHDTGLTRRQVIVRGGGAGLLVLGGGILASCGGGGGGGSEAQTSGAASETGSRGGTLRVGITGGGSGDTMDPHKGLTVADSARKAVMHEGVAVLGEGYDPIPTLAEEISSNRDGTQWTVRLKQGIEWHDGRTVSADDLVFTARRLASDPTLAGAALVTWIDPKQIKKLDEYTVRFTLQEPFGAVPDALADQHTNLVPVDFDPQNPIGCGPFKFVSFEAGADSVYERFENYYGDGPLVDELVVRNFSDDTARLNALLGGEVDTISPVPPASVPSLESNSEIQVVSSPSEAWFPFAMHAKLPRFRDPRVRQAFRLLADRPQLVEQTYLGKGRLGTDIYAPSDVLLAEFPQREQDVEQAQSLLRAAGYLDETFELNVTPLGPGSIESAQVFAEQCNAAGVDLRVNRIDNGTWNANFGTYPFVNSNWTARGYQITCALADAPDAAYPETLFGDTNPTFANLYRELRGEVDLDRRKQIVADMQEIQYNEGSYIIFGFPDLVAAANSNVKGLPTQSPTGLPWNNHDFRQVSVV